MKKITLVICVLLISSVMNAQVVVPDKDRPTELEQGVFGLGATAGLGTGIGLSFRHHLPSIFSYQVAAGIVKDGKTLLYDIGVEIQFDLVRAEKSRFYAGGGTGYFHKGEGKNELKGPFRIAAGIGLETKAQEALHLNGSLYFTYFSNGQILPLPQVGIHYYFF